jgi:putative adhesin
MRNETFQTPEPPELRINLPSGDVRVQTSADATETYVELSGPNEEDARIEQRRDQIVIEIERKKLFGMRGDYTLLVTAPFGTRVDSNFASADFEGVGRFGNVSIDTASGEVALEAVDGRLEINTASGDVRADFVGGDIRINSASGDVEVGIRQGSKVFIDASSMSGDMSSELDMHDAPVGESDGPNIDFRARTMSGDVTVRRA